jgi:rhodanese-related sulfurtransferase/rubrerythrin
MAQYCVCETPLEYSGVEWVRVEFKGGQIINLPRRPRSSPIVVKLACALDEIEKLTPGKAKAILDSDKTGEFALLDVRQPEEYEAGHIPGSILIPLGELETRQSELDRGKRIIAYCRSGHRSMAAAIALCGLGFKSVHHLDGGILNWPYETIIGMPKARPELITAAANARDVLMLAIKLEKGSFDFYMGAKEKVMSLRVKDTFQMLADAEDRHMQRLYEQAAAGLLGKGALPPLETLKRDIKVGYMEGGIEISPALAKIDEKFADEMEALEIALEKEYMSYDFYKRASILVDNQDARRLLHELASEERGHADILLGRVAETAKTARKT